MLAYSLTNLIAEKYRALLRHVDRNRFRRQDVLDLFLIDTHRHPRHRHGREAPGSRQPDNEGQSRNINAAANSLDDPELRHRTQRDSHTLACEITGELPASTALLGEHRIPIRLYPGKPKVSAVEPLLHTTHGTHGTVFKFAKIQPRGARRNTPFVIT